MTAPAGYIRARTQRERAIDRAWAALRLAADRGEWLNAAEISADHDVSRSTIKRLFQAARDSGWVETERRVVPHDDPRVPGARTVVLYRLTADAPEVAPALRMTEGRPVPVADGAVPGSALAALRRERGWTLVQAAGMIGVRDERTVRRYEDMARLPAPVAERVKRLSRGPRGKLKPGH